jgi:hypothetical protein
MSRFSDQTSAKLVRSVASGGCAARMVFRGTVLGKDREPKPIIWAKLMISLWTLVWGLPNRITNDETSPAMAG